MAPLFSANAYTFTLIVLYMYIWRVHCAAPTEEKEDYIVIFPSKRLATYLRARPARPVAIGLFHPLLKPHTI